MSLELQAPMSPEVILEASMAQAIQRQWDYRVAKVVSDVVNPAVVTAVVVALIAGMTQAWQWTIVYILGAIGLPTAYIYYLLRRGIVSDFHIRNREERINPMLFTVATTTLAWLGLRLGGAPQQLTLFAFIGIFQTALLLLITAYWKISVHTTAIAALSIFLVGLFGWQASAALLMIPLVAWARLRTNSHTLRQTVGGTLAGTGFILAMLAFAGI